MNVGWFGLRGPLDSRPLIPKPPYGSELKRSVVGMTFDTVFGCLRQVTKKELLLKDSEQKAWCSVGHLSLPAIVVNTMAMGLRAAYAGSKEA